LTGAKIHVSIGDKYRGKSDYRVRAWSGEV
jgi:hypothetical protein